MNSKHQRFYKARGGNRRPGGGGRSDFDEDHNRFSGLSDDNFQKNSRYRFQRTGYNNNRRFQKSRGPNNVVARQVPQRVVSSPWSKITVIYGKALGHAKLFSELSNYTSDNLNPVLFRYTDVGDAEFLIEDNDAAQAIQSASRRITGPDGKPIIINISRTKAPVVSLQSDDIVALKNLLERRYDKINDAMNLNNIGDDSTMKEEHGNFLPLSRNNVALTLAALIGQACPDLKSINLSKNKLRFMDYLTTLAIRCPKVSTLDLSSNYVENISEIEKLWPWKNTMVDLTLEMNPLCKRFREGSAYVNAIRRLFPKLKRLDGLELPPAFKTGIEEELLSTNVALPPIKPNFYFNDQFKAICARFIDEFFAIFDDSDKQKREQLFQAYDEEAVFTLTAHNLTEESNRMKSDCWSEFVSDSHNIKCVSLWERHRSKMVHKGRLSIISYFVRDFPVVKHDRNTFIVDVSFGTENLICVNVSGLYSLPLALSSSGSTRFFSRVFLLIPKNDGVAVINEQLFCSTVTPIQENAYRNSYDSTSSNSTSTIGAGLETLLGTAGPSIMEQPSISSVPPHLPLSNGASAPIADSVMKRRMMIEEFSAKSKMKLHWAEKCLEDCDWNFENAAYTFSEMQKQNCIPAEAFL